MRLGLLLLSLLLLPLWPAPAGAATSEVQPSTVTLDGPARVVDGRAIVLTIRWHLETGTPVSGPVRLQVRVDGRWRTERRLTTNAQWGLARVRVRPRVDTVYRVEAAGTETAAPAVSAPHRVDNRPPGRAVRLPRGAPRPRIRLPRQDRAIGPGANPVVTRIPNDMWRQMSGVSWHPGCPVGREQLRLLRINYFGYDGYRYRGELVAHGDSVRRMARALAEMHRRRFPIRSMYRVDRFGRSGRLNGGDDYASMAAGNTSAFNCRWVVGRPGVRSPHSYGRALDVNTWENPYRSRRGVVPNRWWMPRSHPLVAWRSRAHPVVRIMARHGLRWTYGSHDAHHFDAAGHRRAGAERLHPQCGGGPCK